MSEGFALLTNSGFEAVLDEVLAVWLGTPTNITSLTRTIAVSGASRTIRQAPGQCEGDRKQYGYPERFPGMHVPPIVTNLMIALYASIVALWVCRCCQCVGVQSLHQHPPGSSCHSSNCQQR